MESSTPAPIVLLLVSLFFVLTHGMESMEQRGRLDSFSVPRTKRYYDYSPVDVASGAEIERLFEKFIAQLRFQ
ncbi:hypothetical protein QR680_007227 [Steinernema hermaphroditum]|uniref:Uncharacterized protein n=1 Tax=Steinernema hermaphroditum TaxID=289476 RepID=A0AA39HY45_9BILA|nr:hypothetical protein QR680_007227 [Steinernema hermaphroditum]